MESRRKIILTDIQHENGKQRAIELTTWGSFSGTDEDYALNFDEIFSESMKSHTEITVSSSGLVSIVRRGDVCTDITVEKGRYHNCYYTNSYGDLVRGLSASRIDSQVKNGEGKLNLVYRIDYSTGLRVKKELIVDITKTGATAADA